MTNFNNNNFGLAIIRMLTALAVLTLVLIRAFAVELPKEPRTLSEFEKIWDYAVENDADVIEINYSYELSTYIYDDILGNLRMVNNKYRYIHPEKFNYMGWKSRNITPNESGEGFTVFLTFGDQTDTVKREHRAIANEKAEEMYKEIVENLSSEMTQKERALAFCEAIADKVEYINDDTDMCHTAYCALVNGYAVCDGYTSLLNMLLHMDGIECEGRLGDANGGLHSWTYANLDGEWLNVDVTWYDTGDRNNYVGLTDAELSVTHKIDYTYKNLVEGKAIIDIPAIVYEPIMLIEPPIMVEP